MREGHQAATGNAIDDIAIARDSGVKMGAIWMENDSFFPLSEVYETTRSQFDHSLIVPGNHLKPQQYPVAAAAEALQLFDELASTNIGPNLTVITA